MYSRGIEVFDGDSHGMSNIIARANRLATQERWNVPQIPYGIPPVINIQVTTELGREASEKKAFGRHSFLPRRPVDMQV